MYYQTKDKILCGDYTRLSREDGDKMESDSIKNQKDLIADYHRRHPELKVVSEYVDDGYSGTNFDRPAFQSMMEDIDNGKINCIVVKDLSRFGRNYIEVGRYLEVIFPTMGIRVIAINDAYDSADEKDTGNQIIVPFRNLINDAFCRDISMKIRSSLDVKRKKGEFIGSFASFGYKKDPKNKSHLVIDEYAAEIVRLVFKLKLDGMSSMHIALKLDEMGVLPPMEYKLSCGFNFTCGFRSKMEEKWSATAVNRILTNELYTGQMVQGKNRKINYKVKQSFPVRKEEWIRVKGTHDAIIPEDVFDQVQRLMEVDTRTPPAEDTVGLFSGFLRCGDCGQNMVRRAACSGGKKYYYYHCSTYKNGDGCSSHLISEKKLVSAVLKTIRQQVGMLTSAEEILQKAERYPENYFAIKAVESQIAELDVEIAHYKDLKIQLYVDIQDQVVSREEFRELNERFTGMIRKAQDRMIGLEEKKKSLRQGDGKLQFWLEELKKYNNIEQLDRNVLVALVDYISVYDKEHIKIHFRFEDELQPFMELIASESEEKITCVR